jgi:Holliday junction resolvasome RuvABC endonuclease subunit
MIVAFDLSLTGTACAWMAEPTGVPSVEVLSTVGLFGYPRLEKIIKYVLQKSEGASTIVIEDMALQAKGSAVMEMAGLAYLIRYSLWARNRQFSLVSPATLKKFITGVGAGKKEVIIKELYKRFGYDAHDNNEADAVGLLYLGMALENITPVALTKPQLEAVETVRKRK